MDVGWDVAGVVDVDRVDVGAGVVDYGRCGSCTLGVDNSRRER